MRFSFNKFLLTFFFLIVIFDIFPEDIKHVLKEKETVYSLSRQYGISVQDILVRNSINDSSKLKIGQVLYIPDSQNYYIVQSGDTLSGIAVKFKIDSAEIKKLNNMKGNAIRIGQKLKLTQNSPQNVDKSDLATEYIVQSGDTLSGIAVKFKIDSAEIKKLNNMTEDLIGVGQKLKLREDGTQNVDKIEKANLEGAEGTKESENKEGLKEAVLVSNSNNLGDNNNSIDGAVNTKEEDAEPNEYVVQAGDTLSSISRKYGVPVAKISDTNSLSNREIKVGQKIKIPSITDIDEKDSQESIPQGDFENLGPEDKIYGWPLSGTRISMKGKNAGVAISANENDKVMSVSDGFVVYSEDRKDTGKIVIIQSNKGYIYVYGGNKEVYVKKGDKVEPGTVISSLGKLPLSNRVELHFSIWKNGFFLDPESVISSKS